LQNSLLRWCRSQVYRALISVLRKDSEESQLKRSCKFLNPLRCVKQSRSSRCSYLTFKLFNDAVTTESYTTFNEIIIIIIIIIITSDFCLQMFNILENVDCEVQTAVVMHNSIYWAITPCSLPKVNRRFEGTCCTHFRS
jgi:hypothetical protein